MDKLKESIFFKIKDNKMILWDYELHNQYEINIDYLNRILEINSGQKITKSKMDQELKEASIFEDGSKKNYWGWDDLSHIFHFGTNHSESPQNTIDNEESALEYAQDYIDFCKSISIDKPEIEILKTEKILQLPKVKNVFKGKDLWETLINRKVSRDFNGESVDIADLSELLYATFGEQNRNDPTLPENYKDFGYHRTSPASGSLQCVEPYVWVKDVEGIKPGIYHYLSLRHKLEIIREDLPNMHLGAYLCNQNWANQLSFAIFLTCRFDKMWWKYPHSRAYRPMLMDVGHLSQTLNLLMTSIGIQTWITGYFHDKEIAELLLCDMNLESPFLLVGGGYGTGSSLSKADREILFNRK